MTDTEAPGIVTDMAGLLAMAPGTELGHTEWQQITQEQVNAFADATGDHQWIHVDVERAKSLAVRGHDRPRLSDPLARRAGDPVADDGHRPDDRDQLRPGPRPLSRRRWRSGRGGGVGPSWPRSARSRAAPRSRPRSRSRSGTPPSPHVSLSRSRGCCADRTPRRGEQRDDRGHPVGAARRLARAYGDGQVHGLAARRARRSPSRSTRELRRWSISDLEGFWGAIAAFYEVKFHSPYERVLADPTMPGAKWFPGATLNYAEHLLGGPRGPRHRRRPGPLPDPRADRADLRRARRPDRPRPRRPGAARGRPR